MHRSNISLQSESACLITHSSLAYPLQLLSDQNGLQIGTSACNRVSAWTAAMQRSCFFCLDTDMCYASAVAWGPWPTTTWRHCPTHSSFNATVNYECGKQLRTVKLSTLRWRPPPICSNAPALPIKKLIKHCCHNDKPRDQHAHGKSCAPGSNQIPLCGFFGLDSWLVELAA